MKRLNLRGKRFGKLRAIKFAGSENGDGFWLCQCKCGVLKKFKTDNLRSGNTKSCGCFRELHGFCDTPEYRSWSAMLARCYNPNRDHYERYGGRGIRVCSRWRKSFLEFRYDMGLKPSSCHTLERKNNDGNYCKSNCRWATKSEQAKNRFIPERERDEYGRYTKDS